MKNICLLKFVFLKSIYKQSESSVKKNIHEKYFCIDVVVVTLCDMLFV